MDGRARIAWNLRNYRSKRGLTQEALAGDADVDRTYISGIENGSFNASVDVLDRLAKALDIDISELFQVQPGDALPPQNQRRGRKSQSASKS